MATTPAAVKAITGSALPDEAIDPFIVAAGCIMARAAACIANKGISEECQASAETFLAAHLLSTSGVGQDSQVLESEKFEQYSWKAIVSSYSGKGIMGTTYGQNANSILGGCLEDVDKAPMMVGFYG